MVSFQYAAILSILWIFLFGMTLAAVPSDSSSTPPLPDYKFPRFSFKRKTAVSRAYNIKERNCRDLCPAPAGRGRTTAIADTAFQDLDRILCLRKCISEECFTHMYGEDPLEPGEIDVREKSFKGCAGKALDKQKKEQQKGT